MSISASSSTICSGTSATLTASGTLSYSWSPGGMTNTVVVVSPGSTTTYTLLGSNGFGCSNTTTFQLVVIPTPTVVVSPTTPTICAGFTTALSASGATSYTWNPGAVTGSQAIVNPTTTTVYTVTGESLGCVSNGTAQVNVLPLPNVNAAATPTSFCLSGTATLSATGASGYTWSPGNMSGASVTVSPSSTTVYTVDAIGTNGCPNSATVILSVLPIPTINAAASGTAVCIGSSGTLTASGAINYTWMPGTLTGSAVAVNPTTPTTYTVTGDNGACTNTAVISLGINPLPTISAVASPTTVCEGLPVSFTATGANNYTWMPPSLTGSTVTDNPTVTTTYTVTGEDGNGCMNTANVTVSVNPNPTMVPVANPTAICQGDSVTLSGSGALSFTWNPGGITAQSFTDNPVVTTDYTLSGTDAIGCIGSATIQVGVFPIPTIAVVPLTTTVCAGSPVTFTASGATNYSWLPGGASGSVIVENPTITTTYTVTGDNGGVCFSTATLDVFVNPLPANVMASASGTITCTTPSVDLTGASTDTNVSYSWTGPSGYTSAVQNPAGITVWGVYTLNVTDNVTGCVATATVEVPTDNSIPSVTATASGSITCAVSEVTLSALNTTTNPAYNWVGPGGYTGTAQSVTVTAAGEYTITVTDLNSTCTNSAVVTVGTHTRVLITASITPATCTAGISNNDGTIIVFNFGQQDRFDLVAGTTYTGTVTYTSAINIPTSGIVTSNLANPTTTVPYTLRMFDSLGCIKDTTLFMIPIDCSINTLGLAKAVSLASVNTDGSYDVVFDIIVKNYDTAALKEIVINDSLAATFSSPVAFTITSVTASGGSFVVNQAYNGTTEPKLTTTLSELAAASTATLSLRLRVSANGSFGPFMNSAKGTSKNNIDVTVTDISTEGTEPDPDGDGNPTNNSIPTPLNLTPRDFFGITKEGSFALADNFSSYDVTYTVTVHNRGNDTLRNVSLTDSLFRNTIRQPATYTMRSAPTTSGNLVANSNFNGNTDINLLNAAASRLNPGEIQKIIFSINVMPDTITVVANSALGEAVTAFLSTVVRDSSMTGSNPDVNNNGIWNEPEDNLPTVLVLPPLSPAAKTETLFIPGGFSPDGDGVNDIFVIKGLPNDAQSALTIFNRWGNRIYYQPDYKNAEPWDARPNIAGTLGKTRVAQGTYYYILEIKDGRKPITGFIVIEY